MARRDVASLRDYVERITRKHGGIEGILERREIREPVLEEPAILESMAESAPPSAPAAAPPATRDTARRGLERLALNQQPSGDEIAAVEAIIDADLRPAVDVVDGTFQITHPLWTQLSEDAAIRQRIEGAIPSVGRIELPGHPRLPYGGTGFVVGDGLLMTNRHVAEIFARGLGDRRVEFIDGATAGIDFLREQGRPTGPTVAVRDVVMIHPYWDMALLAVDGLPATHKPLRLSLNDARDLVGRDIFIVGYPAFDPRNPTGEQNQVFSGRYGVKKLQPGELQAGMDTGSFGKLVRCATHDCSTLGGNSGSAVIDLNTGEVVGLHFGGLYHQQNYCVPAFELARDSRVIAAGVQFAGKAPGGANGWTAWWKRADGEESPVAPRDDLKPGRQTVPAVPQRSRASSSGGAVTFEIPLSITVSIGAPSVPRTEALGTEVPLPDEGAEEGLRQPEHDERYGTRKGYDPHFLNDASAAGAPIEVPAPGASDPAVVAKTNDGATVLDYQNFSLSMHAKRRLALWTASNVTKEPELRKPEPNRDYSRKALGGLGKNDQERWFLDPRLDARFQLPDAFFTKDRGAFDKGHLVRREDVAWGRTYAQLKRANGDTFHVTNCSPQVAGFNRSANGEDNWGDLENHVFSEAASERLCVFAGAVLDPKDEVFMGVGDGGVTLRARIPTRYWKVIVARVADGLAAFGFVLEQNLSAVDFEFVVPPEFLSTMTRIDEIGQMAGVGFAPAVLAADQYDTVRGAEVALRSGATRRARQGSR
jgi:endonuclease G, mitochondrial